MLVTAAVDTTILGSARLSALHAEERQQKDNLCGCFWAALVLRAHGIEEVGGEPVDQDLVAVRAGSLLPPPSDDDVPPGATPRQDYRLPIPVVEDRAVTGTAAAPLAEAIEQLSGGALGVVPVAGPWSAETVVGLCEEAAAAGEVTLIANVRTGRFWGSRLTPGDVLNAVAGLPVSPPPPDWDVGHFVTLAALLRSSPAAFVVVRDTYPTLGWDGYYVQPAQAVAAALERGDGRAGGVLCVAPAPEAERLRARLTERFELTLWDNGTPTRG